MLKQFIMWALMCATAPFVCASEATAPDTAAPRMLGEIVVKAPTVINKASHKVIRPPKELLETSTGGLDVLRRLRLAHVSINPLTNSIVIAGAGNVMLCINGAEATSAQVASLRPRDIERIEYHDSPGVRYAGADIVIDYITTHHDFGAYVSADAFGVFASGRYATIDHLAAQYNSERSAWSVNAGYMGQRKNRWIRDYDEVWNYPDATVSRHEDGQPVVVGNSGFEGAVNYNYMHPRGHMLNVRLGLDFTDVPQQEEGDRLAILQTSDLARPLTVREHTEEHSLKPAVAVYYSHIISEADRLMVDAQTSYLRSRMLHEYSEDGIGEQSRVEGERYAVKLNGIFENRVGSRVWSAGVSGNSSFVENDYGPETGGIVNVTHTEGAIFGEYTDRFGNWGLTVAARLAYRRLGHAKGAVDKVFFLPALKVSYRPSTKWFVRYTASFDGMMPSAAEISDVARPIQTGMIRRGNPDLRPYHLIDQTLTASFASRYVNVEGQVAYRHEYKPIMESVIYDGGCFVRTYFNQRSFRRLTAGVSVSVHPWREHLSVKIEPLLTRYFSRGIGYSHCHSIFRIGLGVDFNYGNWLAYGNIMAGPANNMRGEEIIEEKDMNQIMLGYRHGIWSAHIGVFNAFMKNYRMETRNLSALTPYVSSAHSGRSSSYIAVKFNISLDFGGKTREIDVPQDDFDNDSGILTGTK